MLCGGLIMSLLMMCIPKINFVAQDQQVVASAPCCVKDVSPSCVQAVNHMKTLIYTDGPSKNQSCKYGCECSACDNDVRELAWKNRKKYPTECVSIIDLSEMRDMRKAMWRERNSMASN